MVRTKEELLESVKNMLKDSTSDEALALIEDVSDTLDDKPKDEENWKEKYEENDKMWREKYRDRFFSATPATEEEEIDDPETEIAEKRTFEELFKTN